MKHHPSVIANTPSTSDKNGFQTRFVVTLSSAHMFHDTFTAFLPPLMPLLIERLSLLKIEAGLFLIFLQWPSILQPLIGHLADRINLKNLALVAPAITAVAMSLLGVADNYLTAVILLIIAGLSSSTLHALAPAVVSTLSGKKISYGMSTWMVGGELGVVLGPILITTVITVFSEKYIPWLMLLGLASSLMLSISLRKLPFRPTERKKNHSRVLFKDISRIIIPLSGVIITRALLRAASEVYLPVYLTERGSSLWLAGASLTLLQGFGIVGTLLAGILNEHIGTKNIMVISTLGPSLFLFSFLSSTGWIQIIFLALLGITSIMMLPIGMVVVQENFPYHRSFMNGLYLAILFASNALASVVMGGLSDLFGTHQAFLWSTFICILGLPFIFWLSKSIIPPNKLRQMQQ
jgi:FSR family fosmidomycin resistance protein-like MFS transporter